MGTALWEPGQVLTLRDVSWRTYESLLQDYAGFSGVRLTYDRGLLEIMTPGPDHEYTNLTFEHFVSEVATEQERDISSYGSTTFRREDLERGFEPDSCFYIEHAETMRGRTEIDLLVDPAPELVIEIDDTSSSLDKLGLYARVGVREVWRYRASEVTIYGLEGENYQERENSVAFPTLTANRIAQFIAEARTMRRPDWMRRVRAWARGEEVE
jgi:Uma2 family endonuclease